MTLPPEQAGQEKAHRQGQEVDSRLAIRAWLRFWRAG